MTYSVLGIDTQTGQRVEIPKTSRLEGLYIIGIPGTGKTGLIENLLIQDIKQGMGVGLLDPHGDLINAVLERVPDRRVKDIILLDITDYRSPFGLNLFACSDLTNPIEVQKTVDQVMHIFERLFEITRTTPLIIQYLRNCTHTLIANPGYTMADIPLLLRNKACRQKLIAEVRDSNVLGFWQEYEDLKPSDQRAEREPILRRLEELLQPLTFNIVGQSTTTVDVRQVMDEGKILLVKLSAQLDSITSLIGSILIALILNAAYSRADLPVTKRRQFNLYADEFQRFATEDFSTILVEARKYGLATTIAHQARYQPGMTDGIRATSLSAKNKVVFKINNQDADDLAGEFDITPQEAWVDVRRLQEHRRIEDEVIDEVEEDILEVTQNPLEFLVSSRGTHINKDVREITQRFLIPTNEKIQNYPFSYQWKSQLQKGWSLLNTLLVSMMSRGTGANIDEINALLKTWPLYGWQEKYITQELIEKLIIDKTISSTWQFNFISGIIEDERVELTKEYGKDFKFSNMEYTIQLRDKEFSKALSFISDLITLCEELAKEPIRVPTGKKRMVKRIRKQPIWLTDESEKIQHPQRTYADVLKQVASELANLDNFMARVKYINADDRLAECMIRTLDPSKSPDRPLFGQALQARLDSIKEQNMQEGYLRERAKVEEEIRQRQEQCSKPTEEEPPISRRPQR